MYPKVLKLKYQQLLLLDIFHTQWNIYPCVQSYAMKTMVNFNNQYLTIKFLIQTTTTIKKKKRRSVEHQNFPIKINIGLTTTNYCLSCKYSTEFIAILKKVTIGLVQQQLHTDNLQSQFNVDKKKKTRFPTFDIMSFLNTQNKEQERG